MANQGGSMQFSGDVNQSRSPSQQSQTGALAQAWAQPARMMSQMSNAFGQMPARMLEQEASILQKSFVSPQAWLPSMMHAWEEPFVMMRNMSEEMDQFFGKVMQRPISNITQNQGNSAILQRNWTPTVEISQRGSEIVICVDLPGLTRDDVQLQVHEDKLTIEGERREESAERSAQGYHRTERSYGYFYRAIPLPEGFDGHAAQAKMRDGVLEITVPIHNQQRQGARLEIHEAQEGELREQIGVRQQREQYASQQRPQSGDDRHPNNPQGSQQQEQQSTGSQQRDKSAQTQPRPGVASARVEAKV